MDRLGGTMCGREGWGAWVDLDLCALVGPLAEDRAFGGENEH